MTDRSIFKTDRFGVAAGRRNLLIGLTTYLIVVAISARGLVQYSEQLLPLSFIVGSYLLTMALQPIAAKHLRVMGNLLLTMQTLLMMGLFVVTPRGDYWSLMLLPSIIFAMRYYRRPVAVIWLIVFMIVMTGMLMYGEGYLNATEFIVTYMAAYLLIASYALMLKQTEVAGSESQLLLQKLTDANRQLRDAAGQAEELAVVTERNRLARDLHDSVTQTIFSITLLARSAVILQKKDPDQVQSKLEQLQGQANSALSEMRDLIYQLRPVSVSENGLIPALKKHIEHRMINDGLTVDLDAPTDLVELSPGEQQEVFRIIQEALNNVIKHADVDVANIRIEQMPTGLKFTISDKGVGFDPLAAPEGFHYGFESISARTKAIGGTVEIRSEKGRGTDLIIMIPSQEEAHVNEQD